MRHWNKSGGGTQTVRGGVILTNDNTETRDIVEQCYTHHKTILNPIIDWDDIEVWEFIHEYNVPYCELYDQDMKRLGCIGCPMGGVHCIDEFERYPEIKKIYLKAFEKMLYVRKIREKPTQWETPEEVMNWWLKLPINEADILDELPEMEGSIDEV